MQQQLLDRLAGQASARRNTQRAASEVGMLRRRTAAAHRQAETSRDALARLQQEIAETEVRHWGSGEKLLGESGQGL